MQMLSATRCRCGATWRMAARACGGGILMRDHRVSRVAGNARRPRVRRGSGPPGFWRVSSWGPAAPSVRSRGCPFGAFEVLAPPRSCVNKLGRDLQKTLVQAKAPQCEGGKLRATEGQHLASQSSGRRGKSEPEPMALPGYCSSNSDSLAVLRRSWFLLTQQSDPS